MDWSNVPDSINSENWRHCAQVVSDLVDMFQDNGRRAEEATAMALATVTLHASLSASQRHAETWEEERV